MKIGIYPGSFDPATKGHLDLIKRAAKLVDHLYIGVLNNAMKKATFDADERVRLLNELTCEMGNVSVESFSGLLIDYMEMKNANLIIRGLRAISDYEYELQLAQTNYSLNNDIETIFLTTRNEYSYLSSSIVKEIAKFGGNVSHMVPTETLQYIEKKFKQ
jgi:pantetheine-phosphate adenylyltransferase